MSTLCECGCGEPTGIARKTVTKLGIVKGQPLRFLPSHNGQTVGRGPDAGHRWKGGRHHTSDGYVWIYSPGHPRATRDHYVREHILIVERAIGKHLRRTAEVHHVDGNKGNNSPGNLVACNDHAYHALLHRRQDALAACGDANARRCTFCQRYDNQDDVVVRDYGGGSHSHHRSCFNAYNRAKQYHKGRV